MRRIKGDAVTSNRFLRVFKTDLYSLMVASCFLAISDMFKPFS